MACQERLGGLLLQKVYLLLVPIGMHVGWRTSTVAIIWARPWRGRTVILWRLVVCGNCLAIARVGVVPLMLRLFLQAAWLSSKQYFHNYHTVIVHDPTTL